MATLFPHHMISVAAFRTALRISVGDPSQGIGSPVPALLPDGDYDEALRNALLVVSRFRAPLRPLSPLSLTQGVAKYPLPADFLEPDRESWAIVIGPDGSKTGKYPGSRYAYERYNDVLASAPSLLIGRTGGYGYTFGATGFLGACAAGGYDSSGNLISGVALSRGATFFDADLDNPTPYFVITPTPINSSGPYSNLLYRATLRVFSLTIGAADANGNNTVTPTGVTGNYPRTVAASSGPFTDETDVLPVVGGDDVSRLLLLYAKYWIITERVLATAGDGDSVSYAFFSQQTGKSREQVQKEARAAWDEFARYTIRKPRSSRG